METLHELLLREYDEDTISMIEKGLVKKITTLRVNTLKSNRSEIEEIFKNSNIEFNSVSWYNDAFVLLNADEKKIRELPVYEEGKIYLQSLSSMIPPLFVSPKAKESILDMAAAPGGKTTQIVALSNNMSMITACEKNKIRADRLKYNLIKQGANKVTVMMEDARKLDDFFSFDKILLDAPCSGSGTLDLCNKEQITYFSKELVNRSIKTQKELINKAAKLVRIGGEIVYSTCSILKAENENIINMLISTGKFEVQKFDDELFNDIPKIPTSIAGVLCVCPSELYEGFFVAKLKRIK